MSEISVIEGKFNRMKTSYNMNIEGHYATDYPNSLICSKDGKCITAIENLSSNAETFVREISNINTKKVYNDANNTRDYLTEMQRNVMAGKSQFDDYCLRIYDASETVFREYKYNFDNLNTQYKELCKTIVSLISKVKRLQNQCTSLNNQLASLSGDDYTSQCENIYSKINQLTNESNRITKQLSNGYVPYLESRITSMEELLANGLQKV